jgi:hypothetical protein
LQVRQYLLARVAAAGSTGQAAGCGPEGALSALLQQTELPESQLRELVGQAGLNGEEQRQVEHALELARRDQSLICQLPSSVSSLLPAAKVHQQQFSSDGDQFRSQLHELVWNSPQFAAAQVQLPACLPACLPAYLPTCLPGPAHHPGSPLIPSLCRCTAGCGCA